MRGTKSQPTQRRIWLSVSGVALSAGLFIAPSVWAGAANAPGLLSSIPKTVVLNPETGQVISVTAGISPTAGGDASPDISHRNNVCQTTSPVDFCYYGESPYANQGFYGSAGTWSNTWYERYAYETGAYSGYVCWKTNICSPTLGPNTYATFDGSTVTGTSVTITS